MRLSGERVLAAYLISIFFKLWITAAALCGAAWYLHGWCLRFMHRRLGMQSKQHQIDLYNVVPNYTSSLVRIQFLTITFLSLPVMFLAVFLLALADPMSYLAKQAEAAKDAEIRPIGTWEAVELEADLSPWSYARWVAGAVTYQAKGLDGVNMLFAPHGWDEDQVLASLQSGRWKQLGPGTSFSLELSQEFRQAAKTNFALKALIELAPIWLAAIPLWIVFFTFQNTLLGFWIENRLVKKLEKDIVNVRAGKAGVAVTFDRVFFPWLYNRMAKRVRHWPRYYKTSDAKKWRLAIVSEDAAEEGGEGVLLDTWAKLPAPSVLVWWLAAFAFSFLPYGSGVFNIYCIPLFTKNLYFSKASLSKDGSTRSVA